MKVTKAIIPAAGFGTRFLPATKTVPKEMLPIGAKPVIHFIVEEAVASGLHEIILVTSPHKKALEDYFDVNVELEELLASQGKADLLESVRRSTTMADVIYVRQHGPLGNGHAVLAARNAVGNEPFAVLWGDDILLGDPPVARQLLDVAERFSAPVVGVRRVPHELCEKYGMLDVEPVPGESLVTRARRVVEKPRADESPSDLAQIGGFVLTPDIFDILDVTPKGQGGEIWLADALNELMQRRPVYACEFTGTRYDAGDKLDFLRATVELALADPELGDAFRALLESLVSRSAVSPH